jgi:RimJ/RimL family protein N-acetyltransferase
MELPKHRTLISVFDELRGERVLVRPYRLEDAEPLFEAVMESREHLLPWLPWVTQYESLDDARHFIRLFASMWLTRERLLVGLWDVTSGRFVGGSHLGPDWNVPKFEIGYWVRASAQGRGYVTEAAKLLTDYAFTTYGAQRVAIRCDARNIRSAAVPERLGFLCEARLRNDALARDGALRDTLVYAVTPEEWQPGTVASK